MQILMHSVHTNQRIVDRQKDDVGKANDFLERLGKDTNWLTQTHSAVLESAYSKRLLGGISGRDFVLSSTIGCESDDIDCLHQQHPLHNFKRFRGF